MSDVKLSTLNDYRERIGRVIYWLEGHLDEEIEPAELARIASFSMYHFHRIFRAMTGDSVMGYVRRLRLERAAHKLRHSEDGVLEVALESGYSSHEGFTRAFHRQFGAAPSTFRQGVGPRMRDAFERLHLMESLDVSVRTIEAQAFVCKRHIRPYHEAGDAWQDVWCEMQKVNPRFVANMQCVGRYYGDPDITPEDKLRFDVGVLYEPGMVVPEGFRKEVLTEKMWAVILHRGSYDTISDAYLQLVGHWFPQSGYEVGFGPCVERYINLPSGVSSEDELLTEVWAPVAQ